MRTIRNLYRRRITWHSLNLFPGYWDNVLLENINLVNTPFSEKLFLSQLHWILADYSEAITVESIKEGLKVYDNPVGILTKILPLISRCFS